MLSRHELEREVMVKRQIYYLLIVYADCHFLLLLKCVCDLYSEELRGRQSEDNSRIWRFFLKVLLFGRYFNSGVLVGRVCELEYFDLKLI